MVLNKVLYLDHVLSEEKNSIPWDYNRRVGPKSTVINHSISSKIKKKNFHNSEAIKPYPPLKQVLIYNKMN